MIELGEDARALGISIAFSRVRGVEVRGSGSKVIELAVEEVRRKYTLESLKEDPVVRAYRDFYWRIGIDPTKVRPSSEALVRRILKEGLPSINSVVDSGNAASAITLVPIGLYDLGKVRGKLELRLARPGEIFKPIGGGEKVLSGGEPVLADEDGPIFLYPHRDSVRTMITKGTREVLIVAAGVPGVDASLLRRAASLTLEFILETSGGEGEEVRVIF